MKQGDVDTMSANGVTCVKCMDNRSVTLLSNFLTCKKDDMMHVLRRQAGCAEKLHIPCPTIVTIYNKYMGGVDLMDQKKVSY